MVIYFGASFFMLFLYLLFMGWIATQWDIIDETRIPHNYSPSFNYAIIIPFRDEEDNLPRLIKSLSHLSGKSPNYSLYFIDDHSTDNSKNYLESIGHNVLINLGSGKKQALTTGIQAAQEDIIITIDADVIAHPDWLKLIDQKLFETNADVVVGAVKMDTDYNIPLSAFQIMDTAATMALTAAGIYSNNFLLANGGNFIYKKSAFEKVKGFYSNENIASGDDVFLLKTMAAHNYKIEYLKSNRATVSTSIESTLSSFLTQRKRWATKTKGYASSKLLFVQGFIFFINILPVIHLLMMILIGGFGFILLLLHFFFKSIIDYLFLSKILLFFKQKQPLKYLPIVALTYPFYMVYMAYHALLPSATLWKGRKI